MTLHISTVLLTAGGPSQGFSEGSLRSLSVETPTDLLELRRDPPILSPIDVQQTIDPSGASPWESQLVSVRGVVTAISPHGQFYYISDPVGGAWSGVKVQGPSLVRTIGEEIVVTGEVREELAETRVHESSVLSLGMSTPPPPTTVTANDLVEGQESWEGVLIETSNVAVESGTEYSGEFRFGDATGTGAIVDDEFFTSYIADPGDTFTFVRGVVSSRMGEFRLEPRFDDDLVGWVSGRGFDGSVDVTVVDGAGTWIPAKIIFLPINGDTLVLGPEDRAEGSRNIAYLDPGPCTVRLPAGAYDIVVSRGIEYSLYEEQIEVISGVPAQVMATLEHEVNSTGWISGDFHVHSAPSSDTAVPVPGRILGLAAEGVEWAVATDHNTVTDYAPLIAQQGLAEWIVSSIGDEITTNSPMIGHFNAWPLQAGQLPVPWQDQSPDQLFSDMRSGPWNEIVHVNHPTASTSSDYFTHYDVNSLTGLPELPGFSFGFDAVEVMSHWDQPRGLELMDLWMRMVNNGHRITATGNSDSHHLFPEAGYPRNFVASDTDSPAEAEEVDLLQSIHEGRTFVSYGPLLDFTANGARVGDLLLLDGSHVTIHARVQCPSWFHVTEARVYANGMILATLPVSSSPSQPQDVEIQWLDQPTSDTWYLVFVQGPGNLVPVLRATAVYPLAFTNPIWVDVDGNGVFDPPGNVLRANGPAAMHQPPLGSPRPNPFRDEATIPFVVNSRVRGAGLTIYDVAGRKVRSLDLGETSTVMGEGRWDGRDEAGRSVASGVYYVSLEVSGETYRRTLVRVR